MKWLDEGVAEGGWSFGDLQCGDDVTRTYVRQLEDGTWKMVVDYFGVIGKDEDGNGPFVVDNKTEFLLCRDKNDPGGTELESNYQDGEGSYLKYETVEAAMTEARHLASLDYSDAIYWDER